MSLQEQFCKEYYKKNKQFLDKEQLGIDIRFYYKEYARWLETKIQNTSSNSGYTKCREEFSNMHPGTLLQPSDVLEILDEHFA